MKKQLVNFFKQFYLVKKHTNIENLYMPKSSYKMLIHFESITHKCLRKT